MLTLEIAIGFFLLQVLDSAWTISLIEAGAAVKLKKQMNVPLLLIELQNLFCPWLSWLLILPFQLSFLAYLSGKQVILEQQEDILEQSLLDSMLSLALPFLMYSIRLFSVRRCGYLPLLIHFLPWKPGNFGHLKTYVSSFLQLLLVRLSPFFFLCCRFSSVVWFISLSIASCTNTPFGRGTCFLTSSFSYAKRSLLW